MAVIITYPSALEYWLAESGIPYSIISRYLMPVSQEVNLGDFSFKKTEAEEIVSHLNFKLPVHIAVSAKSKRYRSETIVCKTLPDKLPKGSLVQIADSLYIISPELCFVKAAQSLKLPELVLLGNTLCASYIQDEYSEYGQRNRDPIATVDSICGYLESATDIAGIMTARKASKYILDRANSPIESILAVLAVLPICLGGYGIPKPVLNYNVQLSAEGRKYCGRTHYCVDFVWPKEKIAMEYDSNLSHLNPDQFFYDKKRATALNISGYKVLNITSQQLRNFKSIEELFLTIRDLVGIRTYPSRMQKYMELRWDVVTRLVFNRSGIRFLEGRCSNN